MGQKVNPIGFRLGNKPMYKKNPISPWSSNWYEGKNQGNYARLFYEDLHLKIYLERLYRILGFTIQNLFIQRTVTHVSLQLSLTKTNISNKTLRNSYKLTRNKNLNKVFVNLKKRKLQEQQIFENTLNKIQSSRLKKKVLITLQKLRKKKKR